MSKLIPIIACGLFFSTAAPPTVADRTPQQSAPQIHILANSEEYRFDSQEFRAEGSVELTYGDITLTADDVLTGSIFTGDLMAAGNVTFRQGDRTISGDTFTYNLTSKRGLARNASARVDKILFHGEELKAEPEGYTISHSRFTTCDAPEPHFYLSARELVIQPGVHLSGRDVSIVAFGKRILNVPKYRINLKEKGGPAVRLPPVGISGTYGFYTGYQLDFSRQPAMLGEIDFRISTRQAIQGGLKFWRIGGRPIMANLTYREANYGGRSADLLVSRLPEIAVRFHRGATESRGPRGDSLYLSRSILDPTRENSSHGRINVVGEVGAGYFIEEPHHIKSERLDVRAAVWLDPIQIDDRTMLSPGALVRFSQYGSTDTYANLGFRLAAARRLGANSYIAATYITHAITGHTPFEFDEIEVPHELAARVRFPLGKLTFELGGRYDVQNSSMFDSEISIAKLFHCIEPRITWNSRFREFSLDVKFAGF